MPKIKNWSKVSDERVDKYYHTTTKSAWKHDETGETVQTGKVSKKGKQYLVDIPRGRPNENRMYFSSMEEARENAVKWMRNHPEG